MRFIQIILLSLLLLVSNLAEAGHGRLEKAWKEAQFILLHRGIPNTTQVSIERIEIKVHPSTFICNGRQDKGCFTSGIAKDGYPTGLLEYALKGMSHEVLVHESQHAILWLLQHPDWRTFDHYENEERPPHFCPSNK